MQADLSPIERVTIPKAELGKKLGYHDALDVITDVNQKAQENPESEQVKTQVHPDDVQFDVPEEEFDQIIDSIQQPKRKRRKTAATKAEEPATA